MKSFALLITAFFIILTLRAQTNNNQTFNIETVVGLNFYNETIAVINQEQILPEEFQPENYYRFQVIPKIQFLPFDNKFSMGTHLGFGYESFKIPERNDQRVTAKLFKVGGQLQYEIWKFYRLRPYVELGSNFNVYKTPSNLANTDDTVNYFKSYIDLGIRIRASKTIDVSLLFKDFLTYHSNSTNFERAVGFTVRPSIQDFFNFTHFSITFKL
jgi:hypothetical protein